MVHSEIEAKTAQRKYEDTPDRGQVMRAIGVDVGGHGVKAGIVTQGKDSVEHLVELPYDIVRQNRAVEKREVPRAPRIDTAIRAVQSLLKIAPDIECVGIATTGVVDAVHGIITDDWAADYIGTNWRLELARQLGDRFRTYVENDAKAAAWGEFKLWPKHADSTGMAPQSLIQVIIGSGIGAGIVVNGRILEGHRHVAGEFGSLPYFAVELPQRTGATIETYSASPGLLRESGCASLLELAGRLQRDESRAVQAIREGARALGLGVAALVNIIGPEVLLFGGGTVELLPTYIEQVKALAQQWAEKEAFIGTTFSSAQLGNRAGIVGIAYLAMEFGRNAEKAR